MILGSPGLLYRAPVGGGGAETGFIGFRTSSAFSSTHNLTGAELPAEKIAVAIVTGGGATTLTSCTIAGVASTIRQQSTNGNNSVEIVESDAALTAGNSGQIDVVLSGTDNQVMVILLGIGSRSYVAGNAISNDDGGSYAVGHNTVAGDLVVYATTATTGSQSWTGITGTPDVDSEIITGSQTATGGLHTAVGGSPETFTAATDAFRDGVAATASFR